MQLSSDYDNGPRYTPDSWGLNRCQTGWRPKELLLLILLQNDLLPSQVGGREERTKEKKIIRDGHPEAQGPKNLAESPRPAAIDNFAGPVWVRRGRVEQSRCDAM